MSKIPDYICDAINYINEFVPQYVVIEPLSQTTIAKIPFGLSGEYDFCEAVIFDTRFLIVGSSETDENVSPIVIAKQRDVLQNLTGLSPIFVFERIPSYLFPRYTKKGINIIVVNRQIFLPSVYLVAGKVRQQAENSHDKPPVMFQLITLYYLQREKIDGLTTRELADKFRTSYATINRCVRWMKEHGFIRLEGGKEKRVFFQAQGKNLWETALPFLDSPIDFVVYTPEFELTNKSLISERNALAEYSMLNGGPHRIAVSKDVYNEIKGVVYWDQFGETGVEVWKYDPMLLSDSGAIDKLSLYLLLRGDDDERVQIELENMMNQIVW